MAQSRFIIGTVTFIVGFISPAFIPLVLTSQLPKSWKAVISGLLAFGIPELFTLIAVAVMGKEGLLYLKQKLRFLLKKYGPPDEVRPIRYKIGLFFFTLPLLVGLLFPYIQSKYVFISDYYLVIAIIGDFMLVMSFFILGGNFWDKIRALFVQESKVTFTARK